MLHVLILGTRGVPARHGGFETFAEDLSRYLVSRGHGVTVYCQSDSATAISEEMWEGIRLIHIPGGKGAKGTLRFDWLSVRHALGEEGVILTLGYNTAVFSLMYRFSGRLNLMNMDGVEWKREKWSPAQKAWLWFNELAGARLSTHLIADHPEIKRHLMRHTSASKITVIPYGADALNEVAPGAVLAYGLEPGKYFLVIARPEPENSLLEIVEAYSAVKRGMPLVVLGNYTPETNTYHRSVVVAAGSEVRFIGAIYDKEKVQALRFHARAYIHGHRVGGTNPSLVEALAAWNPIIAHDNVFTRWVAGPRSLYFSNVIDLAAIFDRVLGDEVLLSGMARASRDRHEEVFRQEHVLSAYESLLMETASLPIHNTESISPKTEEEIL